MPSYRTHVSVNFLLGLPLALAALKYAVQSSPTDLISFTLAFSYGTLFFHPDLDLLRNTRLFSLKGLLTLPFRPYSYLFRHRGISHMPLIGTLTRLLWLLALLFLIGYLTPVISWSSPYLWFAIGGLAIADLLHVLLDQLA